MWCGDDPVVFSSLPEGRPTGSSWHLRCRPCDIFTTAYNHMLFCYLWRNFEASCRKHFVIVSREQHTLLTSSVCRCVYNTCWSNRSQHMMKQILVENLFFAYPSSIRRSCMGWLRQISQRCLIAIKLEWLGYRVVKKLQGVSKKLAPIKLLGIFSLRLNLFA